jgi:hypothetical protein
MYATLLLMWDGHVLMDELIEFLAVFLDMHCDKQTFPPF